MKAVSRFVTAALLAGALVAPLALAQEAEPEAAARDGTTSGMMGEDGMGMMPMMQMMSMMQKMGPMMEACLAMMEEHDAPEAAPETDSN